jgi:CRP/FNR family cyclic AMP-dependent transcriptional regulator
MHLEKYADLAFFNGLSSEEVRLMEPYFTPQSWVAGTAIFEQGDYAEYLYLVVHGEVAIHYKPDDGPLMTLTRVQAGNIFGWSAAMGNPAYTSGAVCVLDSEVLRIRGEDLKSLCDMNPQLGNVILTRLSATIAERRKFQHAQVASILASGMGQGARCSEEQP